MPRWVRAVGRAALRCAEGLVLLWCALAIWFMPLSWAWLRALLAILFVAFGVWALWIVRTRRNIAAFIAGFGVVALCWSLIRPTHEREWRADVAVMPTVLVDGDRLRFNHVRDFQYRTQDDFVPRYKERDVRSSQLTGADLFISYWMPGPVGHTFVSFEFADADPISVSIEARPESHEGYAPVASLFKQFELIYIVGEERDLVGVRTNHRLEDVYMYRIAMTPEAARQLLAVYVERINELAEHAEFYHLLSNNCTLNIIRYAGRIGAPVRFNIRHYLNGLIDGYLYRAGRLDAALPFDELRRRSHINEPAQAAGSRSDFPQRIRLHLPPRRND